MNVQPLSKKNICVDQSEDAVLTKVVKWLKGGVNPP